LVKQCTCIFSVMPDSYERIMDEANIIVLNYLVMLHECTCNFVSEYIRLYRNDPVSDPEKNVTS
jgi:hypothetical protein